MRFLSIWGALVLAPAAYSQVCPNASTFNPCDLVFELPPTVQDPYVNVRMHAEFRSPDFKTYLMPAFWDGGRRMVVRFAPTMPGAWVYRVTSNIAPLQGQTGEFMAADSGAPGFLRVDNTRAWSYTGRREPHLWMGADCSDCAGMEKSAFDKLIADRASQKFTHLRLAMPSAFSDAGQPNLVALKQLDERIRLVHDAGIFSDLVFGSSAEQIKTAFATPVARERFLNYLVGRYSAFRMTWQGITNADLSPEAKPLLRELGQTLRKVDPYGHPRSTHVAVTSVPFTGDEWMTHLSATNANYALGSIESQIYPAPRIHAFAPQAKTNEEFTARLWEATAAGQYPEANLDGGAARAQAMAAWFEFMSGTRYWELEPYFDVDGGRALYLTGVEYVVYVDKAATVDLLTEKKSYQVYWLNVATGAIEKQKKDFKGERFSGKPPGPGQWVLHLSRDGRKEGMARSYHFESRRVVYQEVEANPQRVPFELATPTGDELTAGKPIPFEIKLTRESRATREMFYMLTAEATIGGRGARVLATDAKGEFIIPEGLAASYPAVVNLHLVGRNANGKVYSVDRVVRVTK